jgi:hypothetical protein
MSNPFLLLFESTDPYPIFSSKPVSISDESSSTICKDIIEYVLLCTVDEQPSSSVIYLAELDVGLSKKNWDKNLIDEVLF